MQTLLAVDLGLRTGLALYAGDERLLLVREQRTGKQAKHSADELARRVIEWSAALAPPRCATTPPRPS